MWNTVVENVSASSVSYSWLVPSIISSDFKIKIENSDNPSLRDSSGNSFSVYKDIKVIEPGGGESWISGTIHNIRWSKQNAGNVKLEFSTDNGQNWTTIVNSISSMEGSYLWEIPDLTSYQCKIRISDVNNPQISDESENVFSILFQPYVSVTTPVNDDYWKAGTIHKISWYSVNAQSIKIKYSIDGGLTWQLVIGNISADVGYYYWTLPDISSTHCKVKLSVVENPGISNVNDGEFTIYQPLLSLIRPNGGEIWVSETPNQIIWSQIFVRKVKLEYSTDNGSTWKLIADSIDADKGSYTWNPPYLYSVKCKVRVSDSFDKDVIDESDGVFTIAKPAVKVISPNGGEEWKEAELHSIKWSSSYVDNVKIEYSVDGGSTWIVIVNTISANPQSYSWLIPQLNSSQCRVRITDVNKIETSDESDQDFKISTLVNVGDKNNIPSEYRLNQNYPNPFNPSTVIKFSIPSVETLHATSLPHVVLKIYDVLGREIKTLVNEQKAPGNYEVEFNGAGLNSGTYFYTITAGNPSSNSGDNFVQTKKMILMK